MSKLVTKLNGVVIKEPLNYQDTTFEIKWDIETLSKTFGVSNIELGLADNGDGADGYNLVKRHVASGLSSGVGVTEGLPLQYYVEDEVHGTLELFDGMLNAWGAEFKNGYVNAPIVQTQSIDFVSEKAEGVTFDLLFDLGIITQSDFVEIPYCIDKKQSTVEIIVTLLSVFVIINTLKEQVQQIYEKAAESAGVFTTIPAVLGLIARIIFIITLFISLISLLYNLYLAVIQPVKYHYGMKVLPQLQKAAQYLGLEFKSPILEAKPFSDLVILPQKYKLNTKNNPVEWVVGLVNPKVDGQKGYWKGSFASLLIQMKNMFKAKVVMTDGVISLVPWNYTQGNSGFFLPDLYDSRYEFKFNSEDFVSTEVFGFDTDTNDRHTIQEYSGTAIQVTQTQKVTTNVGFYLGKNSNTITLGFALAKRKTSLTAAEEIVKAIFTTLDITLDILFSILNAVIEVVNAIIDKVNKLLKLLRSLGLKFLNFKIPSVPRLDRPEFSSMIDNRIGMLKMESDFVYVPKIMLLSGSGRNTKVLDSQYLTARYLYENYHKYSVFGGYNGEQPYQFIIKKTENVPISVKDIKSMLTNNIIFTQEGEAELISVQYRPVQQLANIEYRIRKTYTNNIQVSIIEPDGA